LVLLALTAIALWLLFLQPDPAEEAGEDSGDGDALVFETTSMENVAERAGFNFPESTDDFLTAQPESRSQMDVTLTIDPAEAEAFLKESGFPPAVADKRLILHSSPLWELNPDSEVSSTVATHDGIARTVELTEEDGRTRVRIVLLDTSAAVPDDTGEDPSGTGEEQGD
jgi:hypothetical protein